MLKEAILKVVSRQDLTGGRDDPDHGNYHERGGLPRPRSGRLSRPADERQTVAEITAAAKVMRAKATRIPISDGLIDLDRDEINVDWETGGGHLRHRGDATSTFNVSTTTCLRGGRGGAQSRQARQPGGVPPVRLRRRHRGLGINLASSRNRWPGVPGVGIGFLFAPQLHGPCAMPSAPAEIGIRTIFNVWDP